jgi:molecular chaperone GrpE
MSDEKKNQASEPQPQQDEQAQPSNDQAEKLQQLQQELESVRKEKDETFARLQRVYADYANFQKRVPKQVGDTVAYERERILKSLLPLLDNLERTLKAEASTQNLDAFVKGVEIVRDQMLGVLKIHGVEPIQAVGEKFDPERHEAMLRKNEPDKPDDTVLEEYQTGFRLNDHILRPSRVAVNKVSQAAADPGTEARQTAPEQKQ